MNTIAGTTAKASTNRSRTLLAPTPTNVSMNSDAEIEKNGTAASPATARASSVLPVPGRPDRSTPFGTVAPRRVYTLRVAQEVDDLDELLLGLVDAGHVLERDPLRGLVRLIALARERPKPPSAPAGAGTLGAAKISTKTPRSGGRPEADQDLLPQGVGDSIGWR